MHVHVRVRLRVDSTDVTPCVESGNGSVTLHRCGGGFFSFINSDLLCYFFNFFFISNKLLIHTRARARTHSFNTIGPK